MHKSHRFVTTAIQFESVAKKYQLRPDKESLQDLFVSRFRQTRRAGSTDDFWVLKDVSFTIQHGESVALIGANGAGKSTILKLVSSIIVPTEGTIILDGRVSALLELGTGFHPDLNGRDNVYLNGSILGLSRREIDQKYQDIIEFADIGDYINLPVKHYSSGMYTRLAFAVASHVDPDILLIDEAISVGDHIFQQRCLKRLAQLKQAGVTLIIISHDMDVIRGYCQRGIWLEHGVVQEDGDLERVIEAYLSAQYQAHVDKTSAPPMRVSPNVPSTSDTDDVETLRWGSGEVELTRVEVLNGQSQPQATFRVGDRLIIRMYYQAERPVTGPVFGIAIHRSDGLHVNGPNSQQAGYTFDVLHGRGYIDYQVEAINLLPGVYEISAAVYDTTTIQAYDHHQRLYQFQVLAGQVQESFGAFYLPSQWSHVSEPRDTRPAPRPELEQTTLKSR